MRKFLFQQLPPNCEIAFGDFHVSAFVGRFSLGC